jgi:hypothetical protein
LLVDAPKGPEIFQPEVPQKEFHGAIVAGMEAGGRQCLCEKQAEMDFGSNPMPSGDIHFLP